MKKRKNEAIEQPVAEVVQEPVEELAEMPALESVKHRIVNHRVSPTDTLDGIARRYNVSRDEIICANMWEYPSIAAGTVLPGWTISITIPRKIR